ncbi:uncharacterized protein LOC132198904 [Neocloeon triangulifer]|uniref:uncharacterized protein LOC132198904 n=1 Tax=Neocloeon triangulifer TaxID=2078957 RepID=UPI00286EFDD6|nr:uncharacterized protein LOC132198904 [Neocloeon triangulifer]
MRYSGTKYCFVLIIIVFFMTNVFLFVLIRNWIACDIQPFFEDCSSTCLVSTDRKASKNGFEFLDPWKICPAPGKSHIFVTAHVDGRLGNVVWSYLTVLAAAKRHNLRPVFNESSIDVLAKYFKRSSLRIPSLQWLDEQCNFDGKLENANHNAYILLRSRKDLFRELETFPKESNKLLAFSYYVTNTEELVPYWNELKYELELEEEYTAEAFRRLKNITKTHQDKMMEIDKVEFVGVHVRRTDYMRHMGLVHPGSMVASPKFFHNAMNWISQKVNKPLIFVVVSDDSKWAQENIVSDRNNTYLGGDGDSEQPGADLALLAACNHTIFAYGTFGLTGALLANNPKGYTIIFNPLNGTVTKEMEFGANLPRWRIMDEDGNFDYGNSHIIYSGMKSFFFLLVFSSGVFILFLIRDWKDNDILIAPLAEDYINGSLVLTNHTVANNVTESESLDPWRICPAPGKSQIFVTAHVDGRLGNVVWSYLTVLAAARRHNLRPVFNESNIEYLAKYFKRSSLRIPSLQWLDEQCNMGGWLKNTFYNGSILGLGSRKDLFRGLEFNPKGQEHKLFNFGYYVTNTEELVPYWNELKYELQLEEVYTDKAFRRLQNITQKHQEKMINIDEVEFVGVHVRRTDYMSHMGLVHPGAMVASPKFFHNAMNWISQKVNKLLIFVVVSDENEWVHENIVADRNDTYIGGDGDSEQPGADLALLAACNHTIFAYGTFGLTGALLANNPGGYTIIFDPLNGTVTKEMEFGANLPRWRIMDESGNFNYEDSEIKYRYYLRP